ncbi:hypothetical protein EVAR_40194_1 [Eumeta japonica]|uniref:Uncharacterized protein n=1 Tax=Eumeta variegata TaxID=151549 RepID=A0A4C1XLC3_EUMVA|nr:hypothetical protein EVAR_40194_1 [Eumeta japonica]
MENEMGISYVKNGVQINSKKRPRRELRIKGIDNGSRTVTGIRNELETELKLRNRIEVGIENEIKVIKCEMKIRMNSFTETGTRSSTKSMLKQGGLGDAVGVSLGRGGSLNRKRLLSQPRTKDI